MTNISLSSYQHSVIRHNKIAANNVEKIAENSNGTKDPFDEKSVAYGIIANQLEEQSTELTYQLRDLAAVKTRIQKNIAQVDSAVALTERMADLAKTALATTDINLRAAYASQAEELWKSAVNHISTSETESDYFEKSYPSASPETDFIELGSISVNGTTSRIDFKKDYTNPIVIAYIETDNDYTPVATRISNVSQTGFDIQLQSPDYITSTHGAETVSYMVVEEGSWALPDGTLIEAGNLDTNLTVNTGYNSVSFNSAFGGRPAILTHVQSDNDPAFVTTRQRSGNASGFEVTLEEEEITQFTAHGTETIGWVAIETGTGTHDGANWIAGTQGSVSNANRTISVGGAIGSGLSVVADQSTRNGGDSSWARGRGTSATDFSVSIQEEQSRDTEVKHTNENVDYFAFNPGLFPKLADGSPIFQSYDVNANSNLEIKWEGTTNDWSSDADIEASLSNLETILQSFGTAQADLDMQLNTNNLETELVNKKSMLLGDKVYELTNGDPNEWAINLQNAQIRRELSLSASSITLNLHNNALSLLR